MDYSKTNQKQEAGESSVQNQVIGDGSQIVQIGNQTITYAGISPSDFLAISTTLSTQVTKQALDLCTDVAHDIASSRMKTFESTWLPRLQHVERVTETLLDPKFHFMLRDANITAAKSSREKDLELLSELLVCHIEKGEDKKVDAGISRAISIVNEIDDDALCALTTLVSLRNITPSPHIGDLKEGLTLIDDLFDKLLYTPLPKGDSWIDHLSVLGCVNIMTGKFPRLSKTLALLYEGYCCVGIKKDSDEYKKAVDILNANGFNETTLVPNDCLSGYVRLPVSAFHSLKPSLKGILSLYSHDGPLLNQVETAFMSIWNTYEHLSTVRLWYEQIPLYIRVNSIGAALAQTNAKRCYSSFPDLI